MESLSTKIKTASLAIILTKCKEGTIVAFKATKTGEWYTGEIQSLEKPNSQYNKYSSWLLDIEIFSPIEPQWYEDGDKTHYGLEDICKIQILEN